MRRGRLGQVRRAPTLTDDGGEDVEGAEEEAVVGQAAAADRLPQDPARQEAEEHQ